MDYILEPHRLEGGLGTSLQTLPCQDQQGQVSEMQLNAPSQRAWELEQEQQAQMGKTRSNSVILLPRDRQMGTQETLHLTQLCTPPSTAAPQGSLFQPLSPAEGKVHNGGEMQAICSST